MSLSESTVDSSHADHHAQSTWRAANGSAHAAAHIAALYQCQPLLRGSLQRGAREPVCVCNGAWLALPRRELADVMAKQATAAAYVHARWRSEENEPSQGAHRRAWLHIKPERKSMKGCSTPWLATVYTLQRASRASDLGRMSREPCWLSQSCSGSSWTSCRRAAMGVYGSARNVGALGMPSRCILHWYLVRQLE